MNIYRKTKSQVIGKNIVCFKIEFAFSHLLSKNLDLYNKSKFWTEKELNSDPYIWSSQTF